MKENSIDPTNPGPSLPTMQIKHYNTIAQLCRSSWRRGEDPVLARDGLVEGCHVVDVDVVDVDPLLGAGVVGAVGEVAAGADAGPVVEAERGRTSR